METAMKQILLAAMVPLAILVGDGVLAQDAANSQAATTSASSEIVDPQTFAMQARMGDLFEVESSAVARSRTQNPDIAAFAQMMIEDHGRADAELTAVAAEEKASSLPDQLDTEKAAPLRQLVAASKADFDRLYVQLQKKAHAEAVALFSGYGQKGPSGPLKDFANKTLPKLQTHQAMVLELAD
jgi:putative membrane protein